MLSLPTKYECQDGCISLTPDMQIYYAFAFDTRNDYLLDNDELLELIYKKRGITKKTVEFMNIGFSWQDNKWVFSQLWLSN